MEQIIENYANEFPKAYLSSVNLDVLNDYQILCTKDDGGIILYDDSKKSVRLFDSYEHFQKTFYPNILNDKKVWTNEFRKKLCDILNRHDVTPEYIIEELGISRATMYRYLNGNQIPRVDTLLEICTTIQCSKDELRDLLSYLN